MRTLLYCLIMTFTIPAFAQECVRVSGQGIQPRRYCAKELAAFPRISAVLRDHDGKETSYSGYSLQALLTQAGVAAGKQLHGNNMAQYLLVKCTDGYQVLFSLAELDGSFTDRVPVLADRINGQPLPADRGPFRLIVPGEKRPARSCYQVAELVVKDGRE